MSQPVSANRPRPQEVQPRPEAPPRPTETPEGAPQTKSVAPADKSSAPSKPVPAVEQADRSTKATSNPFTPKAAPPSQDAVLERKVEMRADSTSRARAEFLRSPEKMGRQANTQPDPLAYVLQQTKAIGVPDKHEQVANVVSGLPEADRKAFANPTGPEAAQKMNAAEAAGRTGDYFAHLERAADRVINDRLAEHQYKFTHPEKGYTLYFPEAAVKFDENNQPYVPHATERDGIYKPLEKVESSFARSEIGKAYVVDSAAFGGTLPQQLDPNHPGVKILHNPGVSIGYNEDKKVPDWVVYKLGPHTEVEKPSRFEEGFMVDNRTDAKVDHRDYIGSGYDRGHMAPSYGITKDWGMEARDHTYMMSNIAPQSPELNQASWAALERIEADDYSKDRDLFVVTGPVYQKQAPKPAPELEKDLSKLVINEVLARPDKVRGDANGDGKIDAKQDEFMELVNTSRQPMDISGVQLRVGDSVRHVFPAGTIVPPGKAVVVFGGGDPKGNFGEVRQDGLLFTASSGILGLRDGGATLNVADAKGSTVSSMTYAKQGTTGESLVRAADSPSKDFILHQSANAKRDELHSPGVRSDSWEFFDGSQTIVDKDGIERLERSGVAIPTSFYKILVSEDDKGELQTLAFLMPQKITRDAKPEQYLTSIDEIEKQTGLDFLSQLPPEVQARLESQKAEKMWPVAPKPAEGEKTTEAS